MNNGSKSRSKLVAYVKNKKARENRNKNIKAATHGSKKNKKATISQLFWNPFLGMNFKNLEHVGKPIHRKKKTNKLRSSIKAKHKRKYKLKTQR